MGSIIAILSSIAAAGIIIKSMGVHRDKMGDAALKPNGLGIALGILVLVAGLGIAPSFGQVPAGARGVVLRFGATTGDTKQPGLYFVTPFIERVQLMDVQIHAHKAPAMAASRDMQDVSTEITLNYRLNPDKVATTWSELGRDYEARIITPSVQEAVKAATAQYDAEKLITLRASVRDQIESILRDRLARHHIILDQVSITNFQFSEAFAQAIEGKQVATQNALRAENEVREAKAKSDAVIATARGTAESIRIQADAIRAQGGAEYVQLKAIEKWDGTVPQWVTSTNSVPFINLQRK